FYKADDKYNSGLFDFKADRLSPSLVIDDKVLKHIIENLYYPKSPYEFSVIGADILGNVYEQFLGKVIRLTAGHQAKVEEKPEVKKAGGVFYTPEYIVDYIVKNTVGRALEGKTPKQAEKLRVLDPACGSGSFLIGAYQCLLDWHVKWYTENDPEKFTKGKAPAVFHGKGGWRLTTSEKKRILVNTIFGVDIDRQAVEVTKLSLLLKVLEDENHETIGKNLALFHERVLPNLDRNIKCGNSLVGPDFYSQMDLGMGGGDDRVNFFDWSDDRRGFGQIMKEGGFDCVIGNPPYGASFTELENSYYLRKYNFFSKIKDVYLLFIERGLELLKTEGQLSLIVPSAWIGGPNYFDFRKFILNYVFNKIILLPYDVFEDAYIDTLIFVLEKMKANSKSKVDTFIFPKKGKIKNIDLDGKYLQIQQTFWNSTPDNKFILHPSALNLIKRVSENTESIFDDVIKIKRGVLFDKKFLSSKKESENYYRYFEGDVYRYVTNEKYDNWLEFGPNLKEAPKVFDWFEGKRVLLRRLVNRQKRLMASVADKTFITNKNLYTIKCKKDDFPIEGILGILNSKLISFIYLNQVSQATKDDFPQVTITDILKLPFPTIKTESVKIKKLIELVCNQNEVNKKILKSRIPHEKEHLERLSKTLDDNIDSLVYELYGLTPEEIKVVEAGQ
ncbi:partial Type IIS restriction enzyme Eco57I, partial [Anaerolineae bacterium]